MKFNQNQEGKERKKEVLYPLFSLTWLLGSQHHYLYYRERFFAKRDVFVPIQNSNGVKFLEFLKMESPTQLTGPNARIEALGLDEECEDKIDLKKEYTNLSYIMYNKGRLYQDVEMRKGLVGFTTTDYKLNKVLGVSSFRLFVVSSVIKIAGLIVAVKLAAQAIEVRKKERQFYLQEEKERKE